MSPTPSSLPPVALAVGLAALTVACAGPPAVTPTPAPSTSAPTEPASPRPVTAPSRQAARTADPDAVSAFQDPERLIVALLAAETDIRDAQVTGPALERAAWVQQQAYRDLVARPDWQGPTRAALPEELRGAFDANVRAGTALRELTRPRDELPDWRIVAPPPVDELRSHYLSAQEEFGVDWSYLAAIHLVETRMGRIRGDSVAGARGPMQFLPSTWEAYGEGDIDDPRDAIRAAARYLVAHGAPGDMDRALYAYNHSDLYVRAIQEHAGVMRAEPATLRGYHGWRVYYRLASGDVVLPEGWPDRPAVSP